MTARHTDRFNGIARMLHTNPQIADDVHMAIHVIFTNATALGISKDDMLMYIRYRVILKSTPFFL